MEDALADLEALMVKWKDMVKLSQDLNERLTAASAPPPGDPAALSPGQQRAPVEPEEATFIRSSLAQLVPTVACGASAAHVFCFGCAVDGDHRPVVCAVARMWLQKCRDDSETANWIKSNTKECSKCQSTIEKNGGCNHMTCKKCKYEFCWVCMGASPFRRSVRALGRGRRR